jgi:hypothetical protein
VPKKNAIRDPDLIRSLTTELPKVKRLASPKNFVIRWLVFSLAVVTVEFVATGGWRPSFIDQLTHSAYYLGETLVAVALFLASSWVAVVYSVPDVRRKTRWLWIPVCLYALFFVLVLIELKYPLFNESPGIIRSFPSLDQGMHFCEIEALSFALLPAAMMFFFLRSAAPSHPRASGALLVFGSLGLVMVFMQGGCAYSPFHVLFHHLIPLGLIALVGTYLGGKYLAR